MTDDVKLQKGLTDNKSRSHVWASWRQRSQINGGAVMMYSIVYLLLYLRWSLRIIYTTGAAGLNYDVFWEEKQPDILYACEVKA